MFAFCDCCVKLLQNYSIFAERANKPLGKRVGKITSGCKKKSQPEVGNSAVAFGEALGFSYLILVATTETVPVPWACITLYCPVAFILLVQRSTLSVRLALSYSKFMTQYTPCMVSE